MNEIKDKFVFKITVIGDGGVGKTSLIKKYTQHSFKEEYIQTIGAQFAEYNMEMDGNNIMLFFWDIAGQDTFHFLRPVFYKGTNCGIIVFSLEDSDHGKESLKRIPAWYGDIKKFCGDIPIVIFGNKLDLVADKNSKDDEVQKIVNKRGFLGYYKTSAKTGENVSEAFETIIKELYHKYKALHLSAKSSID